MLLIVLFAISGATTAGVLGHARAWSITRGLMMGEHLVGRLSKRLDPAIPVEQPVGYDSQFFWALSLDPWMRDPQVAQSLDSPSYRYQRLWLPLMVWLIPGNVASVPYRLFVVNLSGWVLGLVLVLRLARDQGIAPLLAASFYLAHGGLWMALVHPVADLWATTWALGGVWLWTRQRYALSAFALGLGMLTKETTALVGAALFLFSWQRERRLGRPQLWLALAVLPAAIWQYAVFRRFGVWAWEQSRGAFDLPYVAIGRVFVQALERGDGLPSAWVAASLGVLSLVTLIRLRQPRTPLEAVLWLQAAFLAFAGPAILAYAGNALRTTAIFTVFLFLQASSTGDQRG